ncbi:MAG: diaminopimelate decarboxylase, partial [Burkholderiaceae bacterium]
QALAAGIGCFNVESLSELQHISSRAQALGKVAPISLRVNPDVDAGTHPYISTGLRDNKFGIAHADAVAAYRHASELAGLQITGIDCHIGSQITQATPFFDAMERVFDLVDALTEQGIALQHIDLGGGLGIDYQGEQPPSATHLWQTTVQRLHARGLQRHALWCEPGRSLVGNAGVCLSQVVVCKPTAHKNFLILDAAMNDLPRPAMYQAYHEIVPVTPRNEAPLLWDVVGPVCETGDWLGRERALAAHEGDVLAICSAGAYGMSMASQYNARPRAAEVLVHGDTVHLIRERERHETLWQGEHLVT